MRRESRGRREGGLMNSKANEENLRRVGLKAVRGEGNQSRQGKGRKLEVVRR